MTRDSSNPLKKHFHYFSAYSLIKLLFKPNLADESKLISKLSIFNWFIGRYDVSTPLSVKNPLNNEIITDEVLFFKLDPA
jgi:hypothetical protein